jgi:hypothetical protein
LEGIVYELNAVIGLDDFYGEAELCGDIVAKISDVGCNLRFANERKSGGGCAITERVTRWGKSRRLGSNWLIPCTKTER